MNTKEATRKELELAIKRIQLGRTRTVKADRKLSISAVAEEASVSPSLIHNNHPDIAKQIRELTGRTEESVSSRRDARLVQANEKISELNARVEALESDLKKIAIQNLMLNEENKRLKNSNASNLHRIGCN